MSSRGASGEKLDSSRLSRVSELLATPYALALAVVALVLTVGTSATALSYSSLRELGARSAERAIDTETQRLRASLLAPLSSADALLGSLHDEVAELAPGASLEPLLEPLQALATARRGLAWLSLATPDGRFAGVFRDTDGSLHGLISQVDPAPREWRYLFERDGSARLVGTGPTDYDPRLRPYYERALAVGGRPVWTSPYVFVPTYRTGISRVHSVFAGGALRGVLTADYDTSTLAKLIGSDHAAKTWLVADGRVLLASAGVALPERRDAEAPLEIAELEDPVVAASMAALASSRRGATEAGGQGYAVEKRALDLEALDLEVYRAVPEALLYADADRIARRGGLLTAVVAAIGILLALALSKSIARLRRGRRDAEARLHEVELEVRELGSYELLERIGEGGMGEVYRARHVLLARDAALKLIHSRATTDLDERRARFLEEARVVGSLRSVHTVGVYDFGLTDDGHFYLAMELLEGLNLEDLVARYGPQPPARVAAILEGVCRSLAEAHARGLVHSDIKPANVFLCRLAADEDFVKVLDFGLAKALVGGHVAGEGVEGTPAFMAPEQALGEPLTAASDIYALGCLAYFLLVGEPPYEGTDAEVMDAHVGAPVPALPAPIAERAPRALSLLLTRCLAKKPSMRPPLARALGEALLDVAASCADSFPPSARQAFWAAFEGSSDELRPSGARRRLATVSHLRRGHREAIDRRSTREVP